MIFIYEESSGFEEKTPMYNDGDHCIYLLPLPHPLKALQKGLLCSTEGPYWSGAKPCGLLNVYCLERGQIHEIHEIHEIHGDSWKSNKKNKKNEKDLKKRKKLKKLKKKK